MKPYLLQAFYRRMQSPALRLAAVHGARALGVRHLMVRVDTNDTCNLKCPMCYFSAPDHVPLAKPMSVERFERVAAQLFPRTRFLYLSCGTEPLATPHFDQILDVVGRYRVPFTSFCTNGILLRDRFIDAVLRNRISEVIFSVDGATEATYERIRVGAKWSILQDRLRSLRAKLDGSGARLPELRFNFTAQQDNIGEIEPFVDWALQWRPQTLQFRLYRPLAGAIKQADDARTVREYRARIPAIRARCAASGVAVEIADVPQGGLAANVRAALAAEAQAPDVQHVLAVAGREAAPLAVAVPPAPPRIGCVLPWFMLYVKANGAVHPCAVHGPVGNVFESTWEKIDRGPAMSELRRRLRCDPKPVCVECQRTGASGTGA